jgi:hypothetical protein
MRIRVTTRADLFEKRKQQHIERGYGIEDERPILVNGVCFFVAVTEIEAFDPFDELVAQALHGKHGLCGKVMAAHDSKVSLQESSSSPTRRISQTKSTMLLGGSSMAIDELYASEIRGETGLFATWVPNAPLEIGHYGPMRGALFQPMKQLTGLKTVTGTGTANYDFTINATRKINTSANALADAGLTKGKALLEVSFQKEAGVTFSAPETRVTRVDDILALGQQLIAKLNAGQWDEKHGIVIEVVTAPRATIITSIKSGAEVKFAVEANTPINVNVMANLGVTNSLIVEKGVGAKVIGEGPLNPLFRLAYIKTHLFKDPNIQYRGPAGDEKPHREVQISEKYSVVTY